MDDSTPKNLATSFSSSSCLSRFPARENKYINNATIDLYNITVSFFLCRHQTPGTQWQRLDKKYVFHCAAHFISTIKPNPHPVGWMTQQELNIWISNLSVNERVGNYNDKVKTLINIIRGPSNWPSKNLPKKCHIIIWPLLYQRSGCKAWESEYLLPISCLVLLTPTPYFTVHSEAASAHVPVFSAKPR